MKNDLKQQIIDAFNFRHACKAFDGTKKISDEDFQFILETGRLSPSSFGLEPWNIVVVQNMELRMKLAPVSWGARTKLPDASHFVILLARTKEDLLYDKPYIQKIHREVRHTPPDKIAERVAVIKKFQESDFNQLEHDRLLFEWACRQAYIALGNMMTAAAMIGIDSTPIEGFEHDRVLDILRDEGIVKGNEFGVACMLAFGYRAGEQPHKTRRDMDSIVQWIK